MKSDIVKYAKKIARNEDISEKDISNLIEKLTKVKSYLDNDYINKCQEFIKDVEFYHEFCGGKKTNSEDLKEFSRILKKCSKIAVNGYSDF